MGELLRLGFEMSGQATGLAAELRESAVKTLDARTLAGSVSSAGRAVGAAEAAGAGVSSTTVGTGGGDAANL
jgi:hypothetical protein